MARNPFWTWSLRVYKRPGVAAACISLQDRAGVDVNLLLFCLWAGCRRVALPPTTVKAAIGVSRRWYDSVVNPLRTLRRVLKRPARASSPVRALRRHVAELELEAERVQQGHLLALVQRVVPGQGEPVLLAAANTASYFRLAGIRMTARDWRSLKTVIRRGF